MIDVVASSLPYLADKPVIKRTLEECKGDINAAVDKLLGAEENGSHSSAQESSSVEREPDSDEEYQRGPSKKQNRRPIRPKKTESTQALSKLATHNDSQDSFTSEQSRGAEAGAKAIKTEATSDGETKVKVEATDEIPVDTRPKPKIRIKLKPPNPPSEMSTSSSSGSSQQKQQSVQRQTAREKKDIKKQAQKAARKERQQAAIKAGGPGEDTTVKSGIIIRTKGVANAPPIESGFRTLFI